MTAADEHAHGVAGAMRPAGRRVREELVVRTSVALLVLVFHATLGTGAANPLVTAVALLGLLVNVPYYLAWRTGRWLVAQAYARMCGDVFLVTAGLYSAGGLAAAAYTGIYAVIPVYAGIAFSTAACLTATALGTVSYLVCVDRAARRMAARAGAAARTGMGDRHLQPRDPQRDRGRHRAALPRRPCEPAAPRHGQRRARTPDPAPRDAGRGHAPTSTAWWRGSTRS